MKKLFFIPFILLLFLSTFSVQAQDLGYGNGKKYTIGGIEVTGTTSYNEQTVIAYTGLRVGEEIYIPGEKISKILQKLWDLELFSDINFYATKIEGDKIWLELEIKEVPTLVDIRIEGIRKGKKEDLLEETELKAGKKVTENLLTTTKNYIEKKYSEKGYLNTDVTIRTIPVKDTVATNNVDMVINIERNDRVKIDDINISGNEVFSDGKVRRQMKKTKEKRFYRFWKRSKFNKSEYEADKQAILKKYKEKGYRDARIVSDTLIHKDENSIVLNLDLEEGDKYYFGDFTFLGNSVYSDELLNRILRIDKGDVYNATLLQKRIADIEDPDANDITNLYKNNGYLFSRINVVETNVYNDTIDFEIRIFEGKIAYFDHINVKGNDRTNDHVIYRHIYARPGQQYSKAAILRTQRELAQLNFFDPQSLIPEFKNVDPSTGNVDLEYNVLETGSSQVQLQGGYGGGGFVGTLGLSFNNFSLKGIFDKEAWHPFPMGDGQTLSLQAQASSYYQTYRISFSEPWLGGRKPVRLTTSFSHSIQSYYNFRRREADDSRKFTITGGSVGIAKRLTVPDDYFTISGALSFMHYDLKNYNIGLFTFPDGFSNNFALTLGLVRDNTGVDPRYPTQGSRFGIVAKFTPPYSVWNGVDYKGLRAERLEAVENQDAEAIADIDQQRFNWLEYYKLKFEGDWYNTIIGKKLVLRSAVEFGFLGAYNQHRGIPPFERFYMGGDGLGGYALDGRENVQLRGYPNQSITPRSRTLMSEATLNDGATIYNRYVLELRYPIVLKPATSIFMLGFLEGGSTFDDFKDFDPFQLHRSAGLGLRLFLPQVGLLGIDFGYGFDPIPGTGGEANGWETHFIIGQQF